MQITIKKPYSLHEIGQEQQNEDVVFPVVGSAEPQQRLFIICDGDGKLRNGDIAAKLTCDGFRDYFTKINPPKKAVGQLYANDALRHVEAKLRKYYQQNPRKSKGIKSTVALLYVNDNDTVSLVWLGDSRIYHIRNGQLLYKTDDHIASIWEGGERKLAAQTISPTDPAWISVATIKEPLANDLFFMCSKGVSEVLDDRNIKYLVSQSDGTDATHKAIVRKITELCAGHSFHNYSGHLVQLESSPHISVIPVQQKENAGKAIGGKLNLDIHTKGNPQQNKRQSISRPQLPDIPTKKVALVLACTIITIVGLALGYKYFHSSPTDLFNYQIEAANTHIQNADYEEAKLAIRQALQIDVPDSLLVIKAKRLLKKAEEEEVVQEAATAYAKGNLFKAKEIYQTALVAYPDRPLVKAKMQSVIAEIEAKKQPLLQQADSSLQQKEFAEAKAALYEALYLDQKNKMILNLINQCNQELKQDSITLSVAVKKAISEAEKEPVVAVTTPTPDNTEESPAVTAVVDDLPEPLIAEVGESEQLNKEKEAAKIRAQEQEREREQERAREWAREERERRNNTTVYSPTTPKPTTTTPIATKPKLPWNNPTEMSKYRKPKETPEKTKTTITIKSEPKPTSGGGWWSRKKEEPKKEVEKPVKTPVTETPKKATPEPKKEEPKKEEPKKEEPKKEEPKKEEPKKEEPKKEEPKKEEPKKEEPKKEEPKKEEPKKVDPAINIEKEANKAFNSGNYTLAKQKYELLLKYKNTDDIIDKIAISEQKLNDKTYKDLIKTADNAFQKKNYETAKSTYQKAVKYENGTEYARKQMEKTSQLIAEQLSKFAQFKNTGDRAFRSEDYVIARQNYESALSYAKNKQAIQAKIAECNKRIATLSESGSKRDIKKAERQCRSKNYNGECYDYLKNKSVFYSVDAETLYRLGEYFESRNVTKAQECYGAAAGKGSAAAKKKLK